MVRHEEVQQFVDDHVIPDPFLHVEQLGVEIEVPLRGAGCSFVTHGPDAEPDYPDIEFPGPLTDALFEPDLWAGGCSHGSDPVCLFKQAEQVVHDARYPVGIVRLGVDGKGDLFAKLAHFPVALLPVRKLHERHPGLPADLFSMFDLFVEQGPEHEISL